jgi:uncharacterized membrane protein
MTLESSKNLGGIGAILMFVGVLPYINYLGIIELVGLILVLVALHGLANFYNDRGIFNNAVYGVIAGIVGVITAAAVLIFTVLVELIPFLQTIYPGWNGTDWTALQSMTPDTSNLNFSDIIPFIAGLLIFLVVLWIFAVIAAFFFRRSFRTLSARSTVGLFSTAGLLMLVGAVLIVIFGIGLILIWISVLILAIAFFTIKPPEHVMPPAAVSPPPPTSV